MTAQALEIMVTDKNTMATVTVFDGGPGDMSTDAGVLEWNAGIGGVWSTTIVNAESKPSIPNDSFAALSSNFDVNSEGSAGVLEIKITDTDFILPHLNLANWLAESTITSNQLLAEGSTVEVTTCWDPSNVLYGCVNVLDAYSNTAPPNGSASNKLTNWAPDPDAKFSMTQIYTITHLATSPAASDGDAMQILEPDLDSSTTPTVPVPGAALLLFGAIGAFPLARRLRKA